VPFALTVLWCSLVMPDKRTVYGTDDGTNVSCACGRWLHACAVVLVPASAPIDSVVQVFVLALRRVALQCLHALHV